MRHNAVKDLEERRTPVGSIRINADNFARAETDRMFRDIQAEAGGVNRFRHNRVPTPLDQQTVVRMNRDTLYSFAVADLSAGASLTIPDAGSRYLSVMVVNQDHYINRVLHEPGVHRLTMDEYGTPYVLVAARVLVDPEDPADVAAVAVLQDGFALDAASARTFVMPDYDPHSFDVTRKALLQLAAGYQGFDHAFGRKEDVDPIRHLVGTAAGWGGLPESEAYYINSNPDLPVGEYRLTLHDVPVNAFWSISLYDPDGFFVPSSLGAVSVNSVTATPDADGSVTVHFGGCGDGRPNCLALMEGWNVIVRLYRPRPEVVDGTWKLPPIEPAG
jgi:hypothetical protein